MPKTLTLDDDDLELLAEALLLYARDRYGHAQDPDELDACEDLVARLGI